MSDIEDAIVRINRLKIKKPCGDAEITKELNNIQRKLEGVAGSTAVELDDRYS